MSAETRDGRKPVSIRLGEEELALLPKADTLAEAVRLAIVTAADARALKKALGAQLDAIETRLELMSEASDDRAARVEAQLTALLGRLPPAPDDPFIDPAERALMVLAEMLKVNLRLVAEVHALSDGLLEAAKDAALTDAQIDAHVRARIERHRTATLAPADAIVEELHAAISARSRGVVVECDAEGAVQDTDPGARAAPNGSGSGAPARPTAAA
jgi:hypothetical protein